MLSDDEIKLLISSLRYVIDVEDRLFKFLNSRLAEEMERDFMQRAERKVE